MLLREADKDVPCVGKVYHRCFALMEEVEALSITAAHKKELKQLIRTRWDMLHSPMHAAGYALDPEFQLHEHNKNVEVLPTLTHPGPLSGILMSDQYVCWQSWASNTASTLLNPDRVPI